MADDDGKSLRPVRKSKQIAEDMRLAMMMACQLSKQIDKAERVSDAMNCHRLVIVLLTSLRQAGASEVKKKKAAEAVLSPPSVAASTRRTSASHSSISSKKKKRALSDQPIQHISSKAPKREDAGEFILLCLLKDACGFLREELTLIQPQHLKDIVWEDPSTCPFCCSGVLSSSLGMHFRSRFSILLRWTESGCVARTIFKLGKCFDLLKHSFPPFYSVKEPCTLRVAVV
jgi:hypothetical protein